MKKPANDSQTSARETPAPPVYLRVRHIRRLMELTLWSKDHVPDLADEWGVAEVTVHGHAAEASRQLEAVLDALAIGRSVLADTDTAIQIALAQGDMKAVASLQEIRLKLMGLGVHREARNSPFEPKPNHGEQPFWERN